MMYDIILNCHMIVPMANGYYFIWSPNHNATWRYITSILHITNWRQYDFPKECIKDLSLISLDHMDVSPEFSTKESLIIFHTNLLNRLKQIQSNIISLT